jgi:hypothetical protein
MALAPNFKTTSFFAVPLLILLLALQHVLRACDKLGETVAEDKVFPDDRQGLEHSNDLLQTILARCLDFMLEARSGALDQRPLLMSVNDLIVDHCSGRFGTVVFDVLVEVLHGDGMVLLLPTLEF